MEVTNFLMGGNPPIKNHTIDDTKIVSLRKIEKNCHFTVYREN